ncbi:MAG: glycosyltransferase family 2 protein [Promethearchaeati archaeon SRVP18_Atabeyarchaeia-1]
MSLTTKPLILVAIPAYNEEKSISSVLLKSKMYATLIVVCDDGSHDGTSRIAKASGAIVVRHEANLGYGAALSTLFESARRIGPDVMLTLDADGQHNPADIPKLAEPILKGWSDIVIGSRFLSNAGEERLPPYRKVGIRVITRLTKRASYDTITDAQSGFRAYGRRAIRDICPKIKGMGASTEIIIRAKQLDLRIREMPIIASYYHKKRSENPIAHGLEVMMSTLELIFSSCWRFFFRILVLLVLLVAVGLLI